MNINQANRPNRKMFHGLSLQRLHFEKCELHEEHLVGRFYDISGIAIEKGKFIQMWYEPKVSSLLSVWQNGK